MDAINAKTESPCAILAARNTRLGRKRMKPKRKQSKRKKIGGMNLIRLPLKPGSRRKEGQGRCVDARNDGDADKRGQEKEKHDDGHTGGIKWAD